MACSSRSLAIWSSRSLSMCRSWKGRLPPSPACEASFTEAVDDQFIRGGDRDKLPAAGIEVGHRVGIPAPVQLLLPENFPVLARSPRKRLSSVDAINSRSLAVISAAARPGRPVFCLPGGSESLTPRGMRQAMSPVVVSTGCQVAPGWLLAGQRLP